MHAVRGYGVAAIRLSRLCACGRELFRKGFIAEAMTSVKSGYDNMGYMADPDLAAFVIEQLARAGLKVGRIVSRTRPGTRTVDQRYAVQQPAHHTRCAASKSLYSCDCAS